jgi:hypothetical protein
VQYGKRLFDPYLDEAIREYFLRFDHETLSPPGSQSSERRWSMSFGICRGGA